MRKLIYVFLACLVLSCQYDSNNPKTEKKEEVKPLALNTFNVETKLVRVKSTIAWQWKDSSGYIHDMDSGEFAIDNRLGNGKFQCTDSASVKIEPLGDYYEKKNNESSIMEVDKTLGAIYNRAVFDVNYGTVSYLQLLEPVLFCVSCNDANLFTIGVYVANGSDLTILSHNSNVVSKTSILPAGKYKMQKNTAGSASIFLVSLLKTQISTIYTVTTTNPGW